MKDQLGQDPKKRLAIALAHMAFQPGIGANVLQVLRKLDSLSDLSNAIVQANHPERLTQISHLPTHISLSLDHNEPMVMTAKRHTFEPNNGPVVGLLSILIFIATCRYDWKHAPTAEMRDRLAEWLPRKEAEYVLAIVALLRGAFWLEHPDRVRGELGFVLHEYSSTMSALQTADIAFGYRPDQDRADHVLAATFAYYELFTDMAVRAKSLRSIGDTIKKIEEKLKIDPYLSDSATSVVFFMFGLLFGPLTDMKVLPEAFLGYYNDIERVWDSLNPGC